MLNQVNAEAFIIGAILEGAAVACCITACWIARAGQRLVPVSGLSFTAIILLLEFTWAVALFIRA